MSKSLWDFLNVDEKDKPALKETDEFIQSFMKKGQDKTEYNGHVFLPGFNGETVKRLYEEWDGIKEGDVIVASYPKCGTHWLCEIVTGILERSPGQPPRTEHHSLMQPMYLEFGPPAKLDLIRYWPYKRTPLSTHLPTTALNMDKLKKSKAKVVYIMRNPKDQAVSWYHFSRPLPLPESMKELYPDDWNKFLDLYMNGKQVTMSKKGEWYPEHVLSWYKYKDDENVKLVYFEDLKKDVKSQIKSIAEFVEVELTDDDVNNIAEQSSFKSLKEKDKHNQQTMGKNLGKNDDIKVEMYRKGQVGSWKNDFTVAQSEAMDKIIKEKLGHTDIKFTYRL